MIFTNSRTKVKTISDLKNKQTKHYHLRVLQLATATRTAPRTAGCATATPNPPWAWWPVSAAARPTWRGRAVTSARRASSASAPTTLRAASVSTPFRCNVH